MSGPLAGVRSAVASLETRRSAMHTAAAGTWTDAAFRVFEQRYLQPARQEINRFDAALVGLDASLGRALTMIAD